MIMQIYQTLWDTDNQCLKGTFIEIENCDHKVTVTKVKRQFIDK